MHSFVPLTPTTFLERTGHSFPNSEAVLQSGSSVSFGELLIRTRRLADALRSLGVGYGDTVALLSENRLETIEAHFAIPAAGAVIVTLNPWLPTKDIADQLAFCGAECLIASEDFIKMHADLFSWNSGLKHVLAMGGEPYSGNTGPELINYDDALYRASDTLALDVTLKNELDPIAINFTSGTTGFPKGVMVSHRAAYLHAMGQVLMLGLGNTSRYLWTLPMFHVNGWGHMWANVAIGARQIVVPGDAACEAEYVSQIKHHGATHLAGAPRLVRSLCDTQGARSAFRGLTIVTGGAAPASTLINQLEEMGVRFIHQYGLNETCGPYVVCEEQESWQRVPQDLRTRMRMRQGVATIHAGTGLRVVDSEMNDVPADGNTLGEVIMAGNTVASGYFNNPEATQKAFVDGWFRSGDMAVIHPDGYLEIKDRIKDLIYVETDYGWENISSIEIENVICRFPEIKDVAVIGVPAGDDDSEGMQIVAFLEAEPNCTIDESALLRYCSEELAAHKRPRHFLLTDIPKTATGKVRKDRLLAEALQRLDAPSGDEHSRTGERARVGHDNPLST